MLVEYYDLLSSELSEVAKMLINFSINISTKFVEPLAALETQNWAKYQKLTDALQTTVKECQDCRKTLTDKQQNFYQLSKLSDDSSKNLLLLVADNERGTASKQDLDAQNSKTSELKVYAAEAKYSYERAIEDMNLHWNKLFNNFMPFVASINKSEHQKCAIYQSKIDQLVDLLQTGFNSSKFLSAAKKRENEEIFEEKLAIYQTKQKQNLHQKVLQQARIANFIQPNEKPEEKFLPFEEFLRLQSQLMLESEELTADEKKLIVQVIQELFIAGEKPFAAELQVKDAQLEVLFAKEIGLYKFFAEAQNNLAQKGFFFRMNLQKFELLERILRMILNLKIKENLAHDPTKLQLLDILLQMINRIETQGKQGQVIKLYESFRNVTFLKNLETWFQLFEFLVNKRMDNDQKKRQKSKSIFNQFISGISQFVTVEPDEKVALVG